MSNAPQISCEFFPTKTEQGLEKLLVTAKKLEAAMNPAYFSVTFGAGGSTREGTFHTVDALRQVVSADIAPHLSCIASTREQLLEILNRYQTIGIQRIVTLRGDIIDGVSAPGELKHANELVQFIRENFAEHFHLEVAAYPETHPESVSSSSDLQHFINKMDAGADAAITQYFYNIDGYLDYVERCAKLGMTKPIIPGIMPISNFASLQRFSNTCGAEIPLWLNKRLQDFGDDTESLKAFGIDFVSELCNRLLENGAPGLHFYTLNQADTNINIYNNLNL